MSNVAAMPSTVGVNRCRICRKTFTAPTALQINPENPTAHTAAAQASLALMEHIRTDHQREDHNIETQAAQFRGMLRLMCFDLRDPGTAKQGDYIRWYVHQTTLLGQVKDDKLEAKAKEIAAAVVALTEANHFPGGDVPPEIAATREIMTKTVADIFASTLREMRDILQEPKKYPNGPDVAHSALIKAGF